jgi:REP element-mobilizing transposase RayT
MSRGVERGVVFGDDRDNEHFVELLEEMVGRYGVKVHAYVLLWNHYHLLLQTPHTNQSRAMQWLNVSYSAWFNRRHERVGPLFQGRFKSVPIDAEGAWALEASVYLHMNPVRTKGLGLGKSERQAEGQGLVAPSPELVRSRLETLRNHRWSSYLAYAGYRPAPTWLTCAELWQRAQRQDWSATDSYRWHVEEPLKGSGEEAAVLAKRVRDALALGSEAFIDALRRCVRGNRREQPAVRSWQRLLAFERVMELVAREKGEPWDRFVDRHGDDGRDIALWLGRRHCGLTQRELGEKAGGMAAASVGHGVRRIELRRQADQELAGLLDRISCSLVDIAT